MVRKHAAPVGGSISKGLEVRPIENGFIARHTRTTADGQWHQKEVYHPKEPKLEFGPEEQQKRTLQRNTPANGLQAAKRALEEGGRHRRRH